MFPNSLRGYVERALARCKDDAQMVVAQIAMKEVCNTSILLYFNRSYAGYFSGP